MNAQRKSPAGKSELDAEARRKLDAFRNRVAEGRLVRFWVRGEELPGLVALSLAKTIKTYPAVGWVRATGTPSAETLSELNELHRRVSELEKELEKAQHELAATPAIADLAPLHSSIMLTGEHVMKHLRTTWIVSTTWQELFTLIAPALLDHPMDNAARRRITALVYGKSGHNGLNPVLMDTHYDTLKIQLMAYQLVQIRYSKTTAGGMGLFWSLTAKGKKAMMEWRSVKTST